LNVVLISRTEQKLKDCAAKIKAKYPNVDVKFVVADFSTGSPDLYKHISASLDGLDIGVLVNNVGQSHPYPQHMHEVEDDLIQSLIELNCASMLKMTKIVLPHMLNKKKGLIVNVGSAAGVLPCGDPFYGLYAGSKAFVDQYSRSLNLEYSNSGIKVENQIPWFVTSKLSKIRHASLTTPNPTTYARAAVSRIGRTASGAPYWAHALQQAILFSLPAFLLNKTILSHHIGIRKRALKKLEKGK